MHGIKSETTSPDLRYCCSYSFRYSIIKIIVSVLASDSSNTMFQRAKNPCIVSYDMKHLFILLPNSSSRKLMWDNNMQSRLHSADITFSYEKFCYTHISFCVVCYVHAPYKRMHLVWQTQAIWPIFNDVWNYILLICFIQTRAVDT